MKKARPIFKKTTLILVLTIMVVISLVFLASCSEKAPKAVLNFDLGELSYSLYDNGDVYCISYNGGGETGVLVIKVTIPGTVEYEGVEYKVVGVQSLAFDHAKITQIDLSEGIEKVQSYAFAYCSATIINLPSTITEIGEFAFVNTLSLRKLNVKSTVPPSIGKNAIKYYDNSLHLYRVSDILTIKVPEESFDSYYNEWREYVEVMTK